MRKRWLTILLSVALAMGILLTGCDKQEFDAPTYVQAMMDATYHDNPDQFTQLGLGKKKDAEALHQETVDALTEALSDVLAEAPDAQTKERLEAAVEDLCLKTSYKIGDVLEDDGVYQVDVKIRPIEFSSLFEGETFEKETEEAVQAAMQEKKDVTPEELNAVLIDLMMKRLETAAKEPVYGTEETVQIKVRKKDGLYEIPPSGWEMLDEHLIR